MCDQRHGDRDGGRRAAGALGAVHGVPRIGCIGLLDTVAVLPLEAASESSYLALSDTNLYESEPEQVSTRRRLVELGQTCASTLPFTSARTA